MGNKRRIHSRMQLPEYQFIQERILRILSLYENSVPSEWLISAVAQTLPPEFNICKRDLRRNVKSVLFDLKMSGAIWGCGDSYGLWIEYEYTPTISGMAEIGNIQALEEMLVGAADQSEKNEALILTVLRNQVEAARVLINAGADVNAKDKLLRKTAGMYVTRRTKREMVQLLRAAGALDLPAESDEAITKQ